MDKLTNNQVNCFTITNKLNYRIFDRACTDQLALILEDKYKLESYLNIENLTKLKTYSIDNENPFEIDDAISLDTNSGLNCIWIHISNPALYVGIDSPLDIEARRRSSSIYFLDEYISMLPTELINSKLSLLQNKKRICTSIFVQLDEEGSILNSDIKLSYINNNFALSYDDADELLELQPKEEQDLTSIYNILQLRRFNRLKNVPINIEEDKGIIIKQDNELRVNIIRKTCSRILIEEAMILAGNIVADYAVKNNITLPFRTQDSSDIPNLCNITNRDVKNYIIKRSLKKSYISTKASSHYTLGIDSYVQFTSPIRRYIDLLSHYQITYHLLNENLMDVSTISNYISQFNKNYLQYLEYTRNIDIQNKVRFICIQSINSFHCIFLNWLKVSNSYALVHFSDYNFQLPIKLNSRMKLELGQILKLRRTTNSYNSEKTLEMLVI